MDQKTVIGRMNALRGLFAVLIVLGHASTNFENEILPLFLIHKFNFVSVCFFFVVSGMSLTFNYQTKKDYLHGFIINKFIKLILFAFLCEFVSRFATWAIWRRIQFWDFLEMITNWNWFVYEMAFFYLVFYVVYRFSKTKLQRVIFLGTVSALVSLFTLYMSNTQSTFWGHPYHYSSLCFFAGAVLSEYQEIFEKCLKYKIRSSFCFLIIALASCFCIKMPPGSLFGGVLLRNILGISSMYFLTLWSYYLDYQKIPLAKVLANYATEIFLYQFIIINIVKIYYLSHHISPDFKYLLIIIVGVTVLSFVMHIVHTWISKGLKKLAA